MKKCEIRRSAAEAFVNTLSVLRQAGAIEVYEPMVGSALNTACERAVDRLYEKHRAELSENRAADTETAVERLRFLIEVRALLARAKPKDEHETPA